LCIASGKSTLPRRSVSATRICAPADARGSWGHIGGYDYDRAGLLAEDPGVHGGAQGGVDHDAKTRTCGLLDPRGQSRVVSQHGTHADHDHVMGGAQLVRIVSRFGPGDPLRLAQPGRQTPIQRERGFAGNEEPAGRLHHQVASIEFDRVFGKRTDVDLYPSLAQLCKTATGDTTVGVEVTRHDALDSGRDYRIRAGWRAAVMATGLDVDVQGATARRISGLLEGDALSVLLTTTVMVATAEDLAVA